MIPEPVIDITVRWDDIAGVWVATSDDVPGLATEHESLNALTAKLTVIVPELLAANGLPGTRDRAPFRIRIPYQSEQEIDKAWAATAQRRLDDLKKGSVEAVPGDIVFRKIWKRFNF